MKPVHSTKVRHSCEHAFGGRHYSLDYDANKTTSKITNQAKIQATNRLRAPFWKTCTTGETNSVFISKSLYQKLSAFSSVSPPSDKIVFNLQNIQVEGQDISPKDMWALLKDTGFPMFQGSYEKWMAQKG